MSIIAVAFFFGLLIWWDERHSQDADHKPSTCHVCNAAGEPRACHWAGGHWVHDETGGDRVSDLELWCATTFGSPPRAHRAIPAHHVDYGG